MKATETIRRYSLFLVGSMICAVGISFVTRAGLGTSPVSSLPFVCSLLTDQKLMGIFTFVFNMIFLAGEAILRSTFTRVQALQIPVTLFFSLCIDAAMSIIPSQYGGPYLWSLLYLVIGCFTMALGITLEVMADVIMLPAEAFVRAVTQLSGKEFGNVKVCFDSLLLLLAAALSLVAMHKLNGVREGTLLSALAVGQIVKLYTHHMKWFKDFWLGKSDAPVGQT